MRKSAQPSTLKLILITPVFLFFAHHLTVFIHEYAHSFTAWFLGYKDSPFDLNYGGTSFSNLLLLSNIDQAVNNHLIYSLGHPGHVALIAFAGPGITLLLFFISYWLIKNKKIEAHPYLLYFLFFINLWCLGGTYAYVPIRTFTTYGDMIDVLDIQQAFDITPWPIYIFVGYLVLYMFWLFYSKVMPLIYTNIGITSMAGRASLMILTVFILFGYCGLAGYINHGVISHFISATSFLAMPAIIFALWPKRISKQQK